MKIDKNDLYDLNRFIEAQNNCNIYEIVKNDFLCSDEDIHNAIWFIFPQVSGIGFSFICKKYGIRSRKEAEAYLYNDILRTRLLEITESLYDLNTDDVKSHILEIDFYRIKSCMTLFKIVAPEYDIFSRVIDKHFSGKECKLTLRKLSEIDDLVNKMNNYILDNLLYLDSKEMNSPEAIVNAYCGLLDKFSFLREDEKKNEINERLYRCNDLLKSVNAVMDIDNETLLIHNEKNGQLVNLDTIFATVVSLEYEIHKRIESRDLLLLV